MRPFIATFLFLIGVSSLHSEDDIDPFSDADIHREQVQQARTKVTTKFTCISSGTLEGEAIDSRVSSIVKAISEFYEQHHRVPNSLAELRSFSATHGFELLDLNRLSPVEFVDGTFKYSATYSQGTLHLSHLPGYFWTSAMFESTTAEQAGTGQPATRPESKSEGSDKPQPEAEGRSR
jgi:hypothetical protein